ncbi:hypothetical protein [Microvirga puerhi]|uniref:Uncharacterized protein n=1 Tax=Microvirga puerhi TaxID=2876078 RepID=A0ABS7VSU5_9HYPH|nr:hypothetical protein [Microvirga puerhi]MBZ6078226.1 hypothetical protein [Microvirga puerhi]
MRRYRYLVALGSSITTDPVSALESDRPFTSLGKIQVTSRLATDQLLDSNTVPPPDKKFSANDAKAIQWMGQRGKRIDRDVVRGILMECRFTDASIMTELGS